MLDTITIAIPTFERLEYLKEAVASALAQTYGAIEVLIGDNGQSETLREWALDLAKNEPRLRYQRNHTNLGMAGNFNALADAASGEFIVIIGDDDRLTPDFVEKLVKAADEYTSVLFSNHFLIDSAGRRLLLETVNHTRQFHRDKLIAGKLDNPAVSVWLNSVPLSASLIRTRDVRRLRFKEDLNTPEIELFARLAQEGAHFSFVPEYLVEYRVHPQSETAKGLRGERLVKYLEPICVDPEIEPYKRRFLGELLIHVVSESLRQDGWLVARQFTQREYYPKLFNRTFVKAFPVSDAGRLRRLITIIRMALVIWIQSLATRLPACIGCAFYRGVRRMRSRVRISVAQWKRSLSALTS